MMVQKYLKSNICVLPWTSLEIGVNGSARPCCLYDEQIPEAKLVQAYGGKIILAELAQGHSTTATIARIIK